MNLTLLCIIRNNRYKHAKNNRKLFDFIILNIKLWIIIVLSIDPNLLYELFTIFKWYKNTY